MKDQGNDTGGRGVWSILLLLIMPLICCGGPALVALLGATGIGAVFAGITKYWIVGGMLLVIAGIVSVLFVRGRHRRSMDCCVPRQDHHRDMDCCSPKPSHINIHLDEKDRN